MGGSGDGDQVTKDILATKELDRQTATENTRAASGFAHLFLNVSDRVSCSPDGPQGWYTDTTTLELLILLLGLQITLPYLTGIFLFYFKCMVVLPTCVYVHANTLVPGAQRQEGIGSSEIEACEPSCIGAGT